MQYRSFGKIGSVSALGFGCMRLPTDEEGHVDRSLAIPLLRRGYELGINYFDTAYYYCNEESQYVVGEAVKPFREQILLSTKLPLGDEADPLFFRQTLEEQLRRLDTSYIDVYHFHALNRKKFEELVLPNGMLDDARRAIDEGLIRHISFSFHDKPEVMSEIITRGEMFSSVLCQYNLLDRANEEEIAKAHEKGLGVVIMGPVGGGRLGGASILSQKVDQTFSATPELALRFVLGNPNVSCALSGMQTLAQLEQNAATASDDTPMTPEAFRHVNAALQEIERFNDLYCTGCAYCQPCPCGVDIPGIFKAYNMENVYGLTTYARESYRKLSEKAGLASAASACVQCGSCIEKCPQNLAIPERLQEIARWFDADSAK